MNLLGSYNMKKLKFNTFVLALFLTVSFSAKAIPTPEAVEPQYDDDGNPMYYVAYGKGDRIDPATEKPLNLIQMPGQFIGFNAKIRSSSVWVVNMFSR